MSKYLYCIVPCEDDISRITIPRLQNGPAVYSVTSTSAQLAAIVADIPELPTNGDRQKLIEHHEVISSLVRHHDVLPLHFGTVAESDDQVLQLLLQGAGRFREVLEQVRGKVEYTIFASWMNNQMIQEIAQRNPQIVSAKTKIAVRGTPPTLEEVITIGKMVQEEVAGENARIAQKTREMLGTLGVVEVSLSPDSERAILSEAILIKRANEENLLDVVGTLRQMYGTRVIWACNGPLPPYNFSNGRFELITRNSLARACAQLGLSKNYSLVELKEAYHQKARETHPDQHQIDPTAKERFEEIEAAYRLLRRVSAETSEANTSDFVLLLGA